MSKFNFYTPIETEPCLDVEVKKLVKILREEKKKNMVDTYVDLSSTWTDTFTVAVVKEVQKIMNYKEGKYDLVRLYKPHQVQYSWDNFPKRTQPEYYFEKSRKVNPASSIRLWNRYIEAASYWE